MKLEVTEEDLLQSWKNFFKTGKNWRDLEKKITYEDFLKISDKQHIKKILQMPVHFLLQSGKGFFVEKEGGCFGHRSRFTGSSTKQRICRTNERYYRV